MGAMGYVNARECPGCGTASLPAIDAGSKATAVVCQDPQCRRVYDRDGVQVGRWTEGYGVFEPLGA